MARGRAAWKQALDIKPHIGRLFGAVEKAAPALTRSLRYYSRTAPVAPQLLFENFCRPMLMGTQAYSAAHATLSVNNVDGMHGGEDGIRLRSALLEDYFVTGHTLYPINRETSIIADQSGRPLPWGITYPAPSWRPTTHISGAYAAIPHVKNYYHLLVDFLLPTASAILRNPDQFNDGFTFVINHQSVAVEFVTGLLKDAGINARIHMAHPTDTITGDRYLWAKTKAASTEHGYAFRPEMTLLDAAIERRIAHVRVPKKVYIPRTATKLRNLINQPELVAGLTDKGFSVVKFDWMNLYQQIAIFRRAEQIISVHGASLTNMVWGTNSRIREIFPNNARKTTYLHIASQNDWSYDFHLGSDEAERQNFMAPCGEIMASLA